MLGALALAACASTTLRTAWFDSTYTGGPFKRSQREWYDIAKRNLA